MIIDPIQILLIFVIVILAVLLFIIGLEFFQILKELKKTLEKVNKILEDTGRITNSIATPIEEASEFLIGLKKGFSFLNSISKLFKNKKKSPPRENSENKTCQEQDDVVIEEAKEEESPKLKEKPVSVKTPKTKKRFFTKKGKNLGK